MQSVKYVYRQEGALGLVGLVLWLPVPGVALRHCSPLSG